MESASQNIKSFRSGFVTLIGRPNVGKSTLINQLIGTKIAITSPVAQTTRNRLRAILTSPNSQIVFVDTPGIHKPHHLLGERLVQTAKKSIGEVDAVLLLFEGCLLPGKGDEYILRLLAELELPVLVVLNKCDLIKSGEKLKFKGSYQEFLRNKKWPIFLCSASNGSGCDELVNAIEKTLPLGPKLYPSDMVCDQPEKILMAELIREQVLLNTREEVPHSVAVMIDRVEEFPLKENSRKGTNIGILATVFVERKSQKAILIGKGGSMLKIIGKGARLQIQKLIDGPVYLELFVKVVPNWRGKPARLSELGYKGR